ncbi:GntR family transcriptional regulator YhfZ [Streptobacillus felis]|uniref:GntR family transcriptional regulator YhfZ n=1 Tax=Streptobacillus felis TaxID=1384509 RepID=UPI0008353965|nr:GntR family transcriptional regulator YhfZ [Streptobacillus felis]
MNRIRVLNKVDIGMIKIARDLLMLEIGDRVKSTKEYKDEFNLSVGTVHKAFEELELSGAIKLQKKGAFGKVIIYKSQELLIQKAELKHIVGVMPLPYTKRYEGLATAIKELFIKKGISFYFAYMQGSRIRTKMLKEGVYDFAIMSRLAYSAQAIEGVKKVLGFGPNSYVSDHVLLSLKGNELGNRVGIDKNSEDQYYFSTQYFKDKECEFVEINSDNIIKNLRDGIIDKAILSIDELEENLVSDINVEKIDIVDKNNANEAVIVIKTGNELIESLVNDILDVESIINIQKKVLNKEIVPRY